MKILIAGSISPFSGREELYWSDKLSKKLREMNIETDLFMLPIVQNPILLAEQIMALRLLDISNSADMLITIGHPAFVLKHPNKRVLLFSLASHLHEWYDSEYGVLGTPQYYRIKDAVSEAERRCLLEAKSIIAASCTLSVQLKDELNINSKVLITSGCIDIQRDLSLSKKIFSIICETTLEPYDRIDLLLKAVSLSIGIWKLTLVVPAANDVYKYALFERIKRLNIFDRVTVIEGIQDGKFIKDAFLYINLHYKATYIPQSVLQAVKSSIPVITLTDCDALTEIIVNGKNGLVLNPEPKEIAASLDKLVIEVRSYNRLLEGENVITGSIDTLIESLVT